MTQTSRYLGIDLGTTNSAAALMDGDKVNFVRNGQGATLTPSVVRIDARGATTVGARARRALETDPANTRSEFKRLMGSGQRFEFPAAGVARRPEELAAEVLKSLRNDVREQYGFLPTRAVLSVPALFELPQNAATAEAARLAGFTQVELLQEPVASALAAGWSADDANLSWLVYDLGGGTFDASLLETRDGLLRVVGHDGDNFLGGRDIDNALVDWALGELRRVSGVTVDRADPAHALGLRKLKLVVEEAKIELSRAEDTAVSLANAFTVAGDAIDVDLVLRRSVLDALLAPLLDRSLEVCLRLLRTHGLTPSQLGRVVLVGGPTVMPLLRERVAATLRAPFGEGLDPMTLVAHGAALFAATAGLSASDAPAPTRTLALQNCHRVWLQHPAVSSDLTPYVVGRLVEGGSGPAPTHVRAERSDGWSSAEAELDAEGAFVLAVDLVPRTSNGFTLLGREAGGRAVALEPDRFTIMQGLTLGDPPLSRTIGIALANDAVRVYFERGAPLPARRSFVHHTVESVARGSADSALKIPIVQGELEQAHLCRLVGSLEVSGTELSASLPAGSAVELTLELDRGGHLSARALIPSLKQTFERVAHLLVPEASPDALQKSLDELLTRLRALRASPVRTGDRLIGRLTFIEASLDGVRRELAAARGGDQDAAQKVRRTLLDADGLLEEVDAERRWPELDARAIRTMVGASKWVSELGTPTEQQLFREVSAAVEKARAARQPVELQRQLRLVQNLHDASFFRHAKAWVWIFDDVAADAANATDAKRAQELVKEGRAAVASGDNDVLRRVVRQLEELLPNRHARVRGPDGHESGLR